MDFLAPRNLWLLGAVALLAIAYLWRQRTPAPQAVRHPDLALVAAAAGRSASWRRHLTAALLLLGISALVVGLARPAYAVETPRKNAVVVLAIDTSLSMSATDVSPTRLAAAIESATTFVENAPTDVRIGLVTYNSDPHTLVSPTADKDQVVAALHTLKAEKGTAAGEGLLSAIKVLEADAAANGTKGGSGSGADAKDPYRAVVMLADGASTQGASLEEATDYAKKRQIPVHTIAYGTPDATITKPDGSVEPAGAEPGEVAKVAEATGGTDYTAKSSSELASVYSQIGDTVRAETVVHELTIPLAGLALAIIGVAMAASMAWTPRLV